MTSSRRSTKFCSKSLVILEDKLDLVKDTFSVSTYKWFDELKKEPCVFLTERV